MLGSYVGSRPQRVYAFIVVLLLAIPLFAVSHAPSAAAESPPVYELNWRSFETNADYGSDTLARMAGTREPRLILERRVTGVTEELSGIDESVALSLGSGATLDCDDFPDPIEADTSVTCVVDDYDLTDATVVYAFAGTFEHDGGPAQTFTARILNSVDGELTLEGGPVTARVGDDLTLDVTTTNPGSAPYIIQPGNVQFQTLGQPGVTGDCGNEPIAIAPIGATTFTCLFENLPQTTPSTLRAFVEPLHPGARGLGQAVFNALTLQLAPAAEVVATADPDSIGVGDSAEVSWTVTNTGDTVFSEVRGRINEPGLVCERTGLGGLALDSDWTPITGCNVSPLPGDEVTVTVELDYEADGGTGTLTLDPVVVDLATPSPLIIDAQYGTVNTTQVAQPFLARDQFPIDPVSSHLTSPSFQVTVGNAGSSNLEGVIVETDLAGCGPFTVSVDAGDSWVEVCAGADVSADDLNPTTVASATAPVDGGPDLVASDSASFTVYGIGLEVQIDPSWDGLGVEVPMLLTLGNIGALELDGLYATSSPAGASWPTFPDCEPIEDDPAGPGDVLAVGASLTVGDCTVLAGDLVAGARFSAYGSSDSWSERPASRSTVEPTFDPNGIVRGTAEIDGDELSDVEVELRLLDLLELPVTEPELIQLGVTSTPTSNSPNGDTCAPVDGLTAAETGEVVASVTSDASGEFCFDQVPPGTYEIVVAAVDDAELEDLTVAGASGFTTNSPATSEPFYVGFASAQLGAPIIASLSFVATAELVPTEPGEQPGEEPGEEAAVELVADAGGTEAGGTEAGGTEAGGTEAAEGELAKTGVSTGSLLLSALLALAFGLALFGAAGRRAEELAPIHIDER